MEIVTNGALIERKAEANDGRAFAAREEAMAEWASALKDLRNAVDRLDTQMSTMASVAAQICSPRTDTSQSLLRLERDTERSVTSSPSVISSASPPPVPRILVPASPSSSTSSPYSASPFVNPSLISNSPAVAVPTTEVLRASSTEPLPTLTRIEQPDPHVSRVIPKSASVFLPSYHILRPSTSEQILSIVPAKDDGSDDLAEKLSGLGSLGGDDEAQQLKEAILAQAPLTVISSVLPTLVKSVLDSYGTTPRSCGKNWQWLIGSLRCPAPIPRFIPPRLNCSPGPRSYYRSNQDSFPWQLRALHAPELRCVHISFP